MIESYLADNLAAVDAAETLAASINEAYMTADHGLQLHEAEHVARHQKRSYTPEKALETPH